MSWWTKWLFEVMDTRLISHLPRERFHLVLAWAFRPPECVSPQLTVQLHFLHGEAEDGLLQRAEFPSSGWWKMQITSLLPALCSFHSVFFQRLAAK